MISYMGTISQVRQNIFTLAAAAASGERVEFVHKGTTFRLVADNLPSKLSRLETMDLYPEGVTSDDVEAALRHSAAEQAAAWDKRPLQ